MSRSETILLSNRVQSKNMLKMGINAVEVSENWMWGRDFELDQTLV